MDKNRVDSPVTGFREILAELPLAEKVPRQRECLVCYVFRMWKKFGGGDGLELAGLYRDFAAKADLRLEDRLRTAGFTDDRSVVFSAHRPNPPEWDPHAYCACHAPVDGVPWCKEVVRGSTAACDNWLREGNDRPARAHGVKRLWA
jgi:hypothetical protein